MQSESANQSFAAAAEELHRAPLAVSYTINMREESVGLALFDRSKRKAELINYCIGFDLRGSCQWAIERATLLTTKAA